MITSFRAAIPGNVCEKCLLPSFNTQADVLCAALPPDAIMGYMNMCAQFTKGMLTNGKHLFYANQNSTTMGLAYQASITYAGPEQKESFVHKLEEGVEKGEIIGSQLSQKAKNFIVLHVNKETFEKVKNYCSLSKDKNPVIVVSRDVINGIQQEYNKRFVVQA